MLSRCIVLFITLCCTQGDSSHFHDKETGVELEVEDKTLLLEWFANNFKRFGTQLEFITDRSQEGTFTPRAAHSLFALALCTRMNLSPLSRCLSSLCQCRCLLTYWRGLMEVAAECE